VCVRAHLHTPTHSHNWLFSEDPFWVFH